MKTFLKEVCHILANFEKTPTMLNNFLFFLLLFNGAWLLVLILWYIIEGCMLWRIIHVLIFTSILMLTTLAIEAYIKVISKELLSD